MNRLLLSLLIIFTLAIPSAFAQRRGGSSRSTSASRSASSSGAVRVRGYTRKDGTYVAPHMRSRPNGNFYDNWSTKGNVNPYTGEPGTRVTPPTTYRGDYDMPAPASVRPRTLSPSLPLAGTDQSSTTIARPASSDADVDESTTLPCAPITSEDVTIAVVIAIKANLRDLPSNLGSVVREVTEGSALVLQSERSGGWFKAKDVISGREGWVHGNTIRIALVQ